MHLLPNNLGPLADLCAIESTKFAMNGVSVLLRGDNTYRCAATNSKYLGVVEGACPDTTQYPSLPALDAAPNGEMEAIVPTKSWKAHFTKARKMVRRGSKPILEQVPIVIGKNQTTMGATDLEQVAIENTRNVEGRFPPYMEILPKGPAAMTIRVPARMLAELLVVAANFLPDGIECVEIVVVDPTRPIVVRAAKNEREQTFTGAIQPLA